MGPAAGLPAADRPLRDRPLQERPLPDRPLPDRPLADRQIALIDLLDRLLGGDLTEEQEEHLGSTLMILHDRMIELCARYDLSLKDLNLDLGPLGTLLPPSD